VRRNKDNTQKDKTDRKIVTQDRDRKNEIQNIYKETQQRKIERQNATEKDIKTEYTRQTGADVFSGACLGHSKKCCFKF
jgi:hypothetical protein